VGNERFPLTAPYCFSWGLVSRGAMFWKLLLVLAPRICSTENDTRNFGCLNYMRLGIRYRWRSLFQACKICFTHEQSRAYPNGWICQTSTENLRYDLEKGTKAPLWWFRVAVSISLLSLAIVYIWMYHRQPPEFPCVRRTWESPEHSSNLLQCIIATWEIVLEKAL
jgi:hypothetical protein